MLAGDGWTGPQVTSLRAWTTSDYHDIANMLKDPENFFQIGERNGPATVRNHIRQINSALRPIPEAVRVYRKVDLPQLGLKSGETPEALLGRRLQNPSFSATSVR